MEHVNVKALLDGLDQRNVSYAQMGEDYVWAEVVEGAALAESLEAPVRFFGMTFFLCETGTFDVEINLERHKVESGQLLFISPSSLVRAGEHSGASGQILFIAIPFMKDVNFDLQSLQQALPFQEKVKPVLSLEPQHQIFFKQILSLLKANAIENSELPLAKNIARSLVSSLLYELLLLLHRQKGRMNTPVMSSRRLSYVHEFGQLVQKYYKQERSVSFYAAKLFISPKYLSLLVKEASGRSAASWIDDYVIMEAKNMLRFSGRNIQQITYDLNFPNQSSFGKYFKHLTGMSPTQYQKS